MPDAFMTYCPRCGSQRIAFETRKYSCPDCDFTYYVNVAAACGALIMHDQKLLLTRRGRNPGKGLYDLPGGFIDYGETAEEALIREIREELNIDVTDVRFFSTHPNQYLYKNIEYQVLDLFYTCRAVDLTAMKPQDDVDHFAFMRRDQIDPEGFAFTSTRYTVQKLIDSNRL